MPEPASPLLEPAVDRGVLVLTVTTPNIEGELLAEQLRQEMLAAVGQHQATRVVIDLTHTRYVSSIVFWPLLTLRKRLAAEGGRLLICGLGGMVYDVFTTTKMVDTGGSPDAPFETAPDRAAAVARLAAS
jgi:anti-anti-sigma factor